MHARILIADDEPTFVHATAEMLCRKGYDAQCAADAGAALDLLRRGAYDLLISDIRMPGNPRLELIAQVRELAPSMPVILVTGHASLDTAIESVSLPVVAYLRKPIEFHTLLSHVRTALEHSGTRHLVDESLARLRDSTRDLEAIRTALDQPQPLNLQPSVETFLALTQRNILNSLEDVRGVANALLGHETPQSPCHLLECPRPLELTRALRDTVAILRKTKNSFKSKELGTLRVRLEALLAHDDSGPS